ncbi:rhodanese-like domain-containing protein [Halorussus ruber]|uniref:rhodanese-like domain-containing protein n=1 Tax=Halorussus ruber TaxID=1126238 RepID=UPI0010929CD7|nr:rhodanese-like domain-containing protein [Halorussus ruber]
MVETISAETLQDMRDADEEFVLIDTRSPEAFDDRHVAGAENVEYSGDRDELVGEFDPDRLDADETVVTICATGRSAEMFSEWLEAEGHAHDVKTVEGGMEAWRTVSADIAVTDD